LTDNAIYLLIIHYGSQHLTPHQHYCIVLGIIGRKLEDFKQIKEFVAVIHAALKGKITIFLAASQVKLTHIIAHKAAHNINILH
jgi:hypothetical protein